MDSIYISPYLPTERIRHSVLALKANNKTIHEVYEHDSRLKPHFDEESFAGALGTITVLVEGVCLAPVARNDRAVCSLIFCRHGFQVGGLGSWVASCVVMGEELSISHFCLLTEALKAKEIC